MATDTQRYVTPDEYLAREREAEQKHEYTGGAVRPMSGASFQHVLIVTNIVRELSTQLRESDCLVASTDLRVRARPDGLFTYPDVVVVCEAPQFADEHHAHWLPWMWFGLGVLSLVNVLLQTDAIERAIANPSDRFVIAYALMTVASFGLAVQEYRRQYARNNAEDKNHTTPV